MEIYKQKLSNGVKTKYLISFIIIGFLVIGSAVLITKTLAQEITQAADIQYPVKELGNCESQSACRAYCDKPENTDACIDFAEKNNLMSEKEIEMAKNFLAAGAEGPGGCENKNACEEYCNSINHIDECIAFAEENDLIPPEELEEAHKVQAAIKRGAKPPACANKKACDVYCDSPEHMEECITFGIEAGFIQGKELEDVQKMLAAVKRGVKPPPCKGKKACDEYCSEPNNMEVCMNFALEAGFMTEQEKTDSQKMLEALKKGIKPPACKGKEECDVYCQEDAHFQECTDFAVAAGFMSEKDAEMARKTGGKGPGGCKGKEECEAFCNNPNNQETCFNFSKEHGMISEEDLRQMEEGKQQFKQSLSQAPPAVLDCLNSQFGTDMMEKFKSGAAMPPKEIGDQMRTCFEKGMGQPGGPQQEPGEPGAGGMMTPPAGQTGPGGCKNTEECKAYCESHPDECQQNFQPGPGMINPGGQTMPQQAGPGGCKGPDECRVYCESHPNECKNSDAGGAGQFAPGTGPGGQPEGQFPPTGPTGCQTPEECQQMQQQMITPGMCPPEGCLQSPPTTGLPEGQQPPTDNIAPPPSGETPPLPSPEQFPSSILQILWNFLKEQK